MISPIDEPDDRRDPRRPLSPELDRTLAEAEWRASLGSMRLVVALIVLLAFVGLPLLVGSIVALVKILGS